ncbi:transposase [Streptomyces sp. NPDC052107]|uniref:transposase n=1 Tax=Streptomyces sp. NPDC052107 TaxID=3155632 RepID=UPI0034120120
MHAMPWLCLLPLLCFGPNHVTLRNPHHRLELVWADGGYTGSLVEHCLAAFALVLAIAKRSDDMRGFVMLPKRWIVERLFAHLTRTRRLARDFERRTTSAETMVYWSMTLLMTRRLARPHPGRG